MFGKILKKLLGKPAGTIADNLVDAALNKATHGVSGKAEQVIKAAKDAKKRRSF